ncbi:MULTISPECIES: hypothetical protein [unclassified Paraburkholderia]|uniref:hypothetical protein n=1 Tax=unclassified Paraburkholderia TaxID=2615204 RepID=UPI0016211871|nr:MULTISPECIES: hypothetical protein [unclassified Paraburkholderia]MBB5444677.1 hypothetical protein [Paraburkholderia sp. WSM4177]MBB5485502.1 hypothetical protein [Paraburkholderia sp. WSM4180]
MKAALLALCLTGCAGQATYDVRPFYDEASKQVLCCAASISNGKDISSVTVHVQKTADGYALDFAETGVGATAPIAAQSQATTAVAGAVSSAAAAVIKLAP